MSENDSCTSDTQRLTGKPYKYTGEHAGRYETRHEAIGEETIAARKRTKRRFDTTLTPKGYRGVIGRVYAYKTHMCEYCHETFLYEEDYEEHKTCPWWEYDEGDREEMPS